jgi:hypothetical protein
VERFGDQPYIDRSISEGAASPGWEDERVDRLVPKIELAAVGRPGRSREELGEVQGRLRPAEGPVLERDVVQNARSGKAAQGGRPVRCVGECRMNILS